MSVLHRALEIANTGTREYNPSTLGAPDYDESQEIAEALLEAKGLGLIYEAKEERSKARESYGHIKRVVIAGGLTPKGKKALSETTRTNITLPSQELPRSRSESKEPEIFQLKPTFAGISIDLKALWRKWRASR